MDEETLYETLTTRPDRRKSIRISCADCGSPDHVKRVRYSFRQGEDKVVCDKPLCVRCRKKLNKPNLSEKRKEIVS